MASKFSEDKLEEIRAQFDQVILALIILQKNLIIIIITILHYIINVFFLQFDADHNGHITCSEIAEVLKALGETTPGYKIRDMIKEVDIDENGTIEFNEFLEVRRGSVYVLPLMLMRIVCVCV